MEMEKRTRKFRSLTLKKRSLVSLKKYFNQKQIKYIMEIEATRKLEICKKRKIIDQLSNYKSERARKRDFLMMALKALNLKLKYISFRGYK
jgi:hypothetical protein